jgi:hypothetical protein
MEILEQTAVTPDVLAELEAELRNLRNLGDLLDWARSLRPPVRSPVVVTQDEYTHDVVVPWRAPLVLAFDTT